MFYLCQLIEPRSLLIALGVREEQAGTLNMKLTASQVTQSWWWVTRAWSECELAVFLLLKTSRLGDMVVQHADSGQSGRAGSAFVGCPSLLPHP